MHSFSLAKNVGAYVAVFPSDGVIDAEVTTATHSTVSGNWIDRTVDLQFMYQSAKVCVAIQGQTTEDETFTVSCNLQDAATSTGSGAADFGTTADVDLIMGSTASTADQVVTGVLEYNVDLTTADRFIRTQISLAFSSASTAGVNQCDHAAPFLILGGSESLEAT